MRRSYYVDQNNRILFVIFIVTILTISAFLLLLALSPGLFYIRFQKEMFGEFQILCIVGGASVLGSSFSILNTYLFSISRYVYNSSMMYRHIIRIFLALASSFVIYVFIRGFILRPDADVLYLNKYGIATLIFCAGFSESLIIKRLTELLRTAAGEKSKLEEQIVQISNVLGAQVLTNYSGYLHFKIVNNSQIERRLIAWFVPHSFYDQRMPDHRLEPIIITGGSDEREIEFTLTINGNQNKVYPNERRIRFEVQQESRPVEFSIESYEIDVNDELYVQVSQKNKVVAVISTRLNRG